MYECQFFFLEHYFITMQWPQWMVFSHVCERYQACIRWTHYYMSCYYNDIDAPRYQHNTKATRGFSRAVRVQLLSIKREGPSCRQQCMLAVIDRVKVLRPTRHRIRRFGNVLPCQSVGVVRGGFRHVQHVRPNSGPHKKGLHICKCRII